MTVDSHISVQPSVQCLVFSVGTQPSRLLDVSPFHLDVALHSRTWRSGTTHWISERSGREMLTTTFTPAPATSSSVTVTCYYMEQLGL